MAEPVHKARDQSEDLICCSQTARSERIEPRNGMSKLIRRLELDTEPLRASGKKESGGSLWNPAIWYGVSSSWLPGYVGIGRRTSISGETPRPGDGRDLTR
jgi:hypothetical protein